MRIDPLPCITAAELGLDLQGKIVRRKPLACRGRKEYKSAVLVVVYPQHSEAPPPSGVFHFHPCPAPVSEGRAGPPVQLFSGRLWAAFFVSGDGMSKHVTINGNQISGSQENLADAIAAAIAQARQGRVVSVAQIIKTAQPNTGVTITDTASGQTEVVK